MNNNLFATQRTYGAAPTDAVNNAGGIAYQRSDKESLAQYALTGTFNNTFYIKAEDQLKDILTLAAKVDIEFVAKLAVHASQDGYMKDMPAALLAYVFSKDTALAAKAFLKIVTNGKMLRNFVQMVRSGVFGRKSFGNRMKKLIQEWLLNANEYQLLQASIGDKPRLADVVKMVHPSPKEEWQKQWFAWLIGKPFEIDKLPELTQSFEKFKKIILSDDMIPQLVDVPDVPFQMLTSLSLTTEQWTKIALRGSWQMVRQNLNTFERHGVFKNDEVTEQIANKLRNPEAIKKAKVFPYQLMAAYLNIEDTMPHSIKEALQDAMELATENVPVLQGNVVICPDVSGSMRNAITGHQKGATSKVRCIDVAALVTACLLKKNPRAQIAPFENRIVPVKINSRDSIMTIAQQLAAIGGGGTNLAVVMECVVSASTKGYIADTVVYVSDNESWDQVAPQGSAMSMFRNYGATNVLWKQHLKTNPKAKMICIDIQPGTTTQTENDPSIARIGGFSDNVFKIMQDFISGESGQDYWTKRIEAITL
jgi:60 kDa SS-A/Ro ribonucleoprotein